jgi:hypothetical protein
VTRIGRTSFAVAQPFADDNREPDEQSSDGGGNHDETDKAHSAKHDVAHRDLTGDGWLSNGLNDDGA